VRNVVGALRRVCGQPREVVLDVEEEREAFGADLDIAASEAYGGRRKSCYYRTPR
jgi:hypothetical protein